MEYYITKNKLSIIRVCKTGVGREKSYYYGGCAILTPLYLLYSRWYFVLIKVNMNMIMEIKIHFVLYISTKRFKRAIKNPNNSLWKKEKIRIIYLSKRENCFEQISFDELFKQI